MGRGELTDEVKKVSVDQLGYVVDVAELRLMPYLQYCIMNSEVMSLHKLNDEDHEVLHKEDKKGFIDGRMMQPNLTKMFYVAISEILCAAYCQDSIIN